MSNQSETEKFYEMLGTLVVSFQGLEQAIEHMIFACMTSPYLQVRILLSEMSFKAKVSVMNALIKDLHGPEEEIFNVGNIHDALARIVKGCREIEERRNQLMHSSWVPGFKSAPDFVLRLKETAKSKKGYGYSVESFDHSTLESDLAKIEETRLELNDMCNKLSIQFKRVHGIAGMENCFNHSLLVEAIHKSVIAR